MIFDDVGAFLVVADLVGELPPAPVFGLFERAVDALDDLLDLRRAGRRPALRSPPASTM